MSIQIESDPSPAEVQILPCQYVSRCRARRCSATAAFIARYLDAGGVFLRQYELCDSHASRLIARDTARRIMVGGYWSNATGPKHLTKPLESRNVKSA